MTRTLHGVIFDMDGVLVDSTEAHYLAWSRLGKELGVPHPREVFETTFGMHNRQIIPIWLGNRVTPEDVELTELSPARVLKLLDPGRPA